MSVATELTALQVDITAARTAIVNKGGTVTSDGGSSQLATDIATIPTGITPSGSINITTNGTYDVTSKASAVVNVLPTLQDKTVSPTTSQQSITADSGYDGLGTVTVNAMPSGEMSSLSLNTTTGVVTSTIGTSGYLASGTSKTYSLSTQSAKTITPTTSSQTAVAGGKYTTGVVTVAAIQTETKTVTANGTVTPTSGKYLTSVTVNVPATPTQSKTLTLGASAPSTVNPDSGYALSSVPVSIDNTIIKAENIAEGVTMLGITGTHQGGGGGGKTVTYTENAAGGVTCTIS